ncbi:MAG: hypothetical protein JSV98_00360 [candidate division WOR-3 bacterium]|nr:MAG: hypothetical protein JSV98_00360 [candidate division WOR-3 bacterium]
MIAALPVANCRLGGETKSDWSLNDWQRCSSEAAGVDTSGALSIIIS